jgi:protoheme IX farnesyltransferase
VTQPLAESLAESKKGAVPSRVAIADLVALAKPRITLMVIITMAGGLWLAHRAGGGKVGALTVFCALFGTSLIVAGANALNMYLEREIDKKMARTKNRPLPAGRMSPKVALWFGVVTSSLSVPILAIGVNSLTALLAVLANVSYVLAYTPLKQRSHHALLVGAVPGAIPPLLGWTAGTDHVGAAGIVLFSVLFLWQVPHFLAITLFRKGEYARAGLVVTPNVVGDEATRHAIVRYTFALVGASLLLYPLGVAHRAYVIVAVVLGAMFFTAGLAGLRKKPGGGQSNRWARGLFLVSMVYLVGLFAALVIDA